MRGSSLCLCGSAEKRVECTKLSELLCDLESLALVISGNHDDREAFRDRRYWPGSSQMCHVLDKPGPVCIGALDLTLPGLHHGMVDEAGM